MTTVAWDGKTLACDSQVTVGNCRGTSVKLVSNDQGFVAAGAGSLPELVPWFRWVENGMDPDQQPTSLSESDLVIVPPRGPAIWFSGSASPMKLPRRHWAIGSGSDFALGAMAMGADARQEVKVAMKFDVYTSGRVQYRTRG
jgi:ATP-dependent protease HslVU (ClpYQ) peptidase subunit